MYHKPLLPNFGVRGANAFLGGHVTILVKFIYFQKVKVLAGLVSGRKSATKCPYYRGGQGGRVQTIFGQCQNRWNNFYKESSQYSIHDMSLSLILNWRKNYDRKNWFDQKHSMSPSPDWLRCAITQNVGKNNVNNEKDKDESFTRKNHQDFFLHKSFLDNSWAAMSICTHSVFCASDALNEALIFSAISSSFLSSSFFCAWSMKICIKK